MRFIYVDEAGISAPEPVTVVCGIVVNADTQWMNLASILEMIKDKHLPSAHRNNYVLHAKKIFSGGKELPIKDFNIDYRTKIICEVLDARLKIGAALCVGYYHRQPSIKDVPKQKQIDIEHLLAFCLCIGAANDYIKQKCHNELAIIVAENNNSMKKMLRPVPAMLRTPSFLETIMPEMRALYPITNIVGPVHFAEKYEDPLLQVADACAFSIRRYLAKQSKGDDLFKAAMGIDDVDKLDMKIDPRTSQYGAFSSGYP